MLFIKQLGPRKQQGGIQDSILPSDHARDFSHLQSQPGGSTDKAKV